MVKPLRAGLLLSRSPVITPEPSAFAKVYYNYMTELEKRLMWTFPAHFYFKRGSLAQRKFNDLQKEPIARQKDAYYPDGPPDIYYNRDRRFKQEIKIVPEELEKVRLQPREKEGLPNTDLSRKLSKTLHLLIKNGSVWRLPSFEVQDDAASLHQVTESGIHELGGENMNIWTVSGTPAAVLKSGDKPEFIIRSRILHGQFSPKNSVEFAWLDKDEIKDAVDAKYFAEIEGLL